MNKTKGVFLCPIFYNAIYNFKIKTNKNEKIYFTFM